MPSFSADPADAPENPNPWGPQVAVGSIFPFTKPFFFGVPGIFDHSKISGFRSFPLASLEGDRPSCSQNGR